MVKKSLLLAALMAGAMSVTALAESYAHLETPYGTVDILGTEAYSTEYYDYVIVYGQYINTTERSTDPGSNIMHEIYQNGIELETGFLTLDADIVHGAFSIHTKVRPGTTIQYYQVYKTPSNSDPVDIEIRAVGDLRNIVECTLPLNSELIDASENQYTSGDPTEAAPSEAVPNPYEERIAALEALVADLTARIEALEAK